MAIQQDNTTREQIENAIMRFAPMVTLSPGTTSDDVRRTIRVFMRKHPEIFWFSHQYRYDDKTGVIRFKYNFTREKADFFNGEIEKVVKDDFQIDYVKSLSEIERLVYVYKWIVNRTTYNEYSSFNQTIYSVLVNRNSVCTGYAKTAQYLLGLVGIESELVFGKFNVDKSDGGRHGWNIVKIDGEWYHVDFCLADPLLKYLLNSDETPVEHDGLLWNYFCKPTEYVLHNRSIEFVDVYPKCIQSIDKLFRISLAKPQRRLFVCKSNSGTSAKIYLDSYDKHNVIKVARNNQNLIDNEIEMLQRLNGCKQIIQYKGHTEDGIILEQLTPWGELLNSHYYHPHEEQLKDILIQLTKGLIECRDKGISYSDIHYNNVFVTKNGKYKWGDFGIAYSSSSNGHLPPQMIGDDGIAFGNRWFMAPETYREGIFTESSAIYSLAMLAYFVMNDLRPPFWPEEKYQDVALAKRLNGKELPAPVFIDRFKDLWKLIRNVLSLSADSRHCSYEDFINWIESDYIVINGISVVDSECRQTEMVDCESPILIDVDNNGCIDDSFASTTYIEEDFPVDNSEKFASTMGGRWGDEFIHDSDSFACSCGIVDREIEPKQSLMRETYGLIYSGSTEKRSIWDKLFGKKEKKEYVNAGAYAPAEILYHKHFLVRVFIHRPEESSGIDQIVKDIDTTAVKKANRSLDVPIKNGDRITIYLSMTDGVAIDEPIQEFTWRGHYIECDFGCELTKKCFNSVLGKAIIAINNVPCGDLKFTIDVVSVEPAKVYGHVETRRYSKIFISYAHADYSQVRGIAEGCKMNGSDYFFDRHTLQAGDIFKEKILQYIENADLFVLCWSKNAAESEWVQIERKYALKLIERGNHQLTIYPLSMPPEAPLPADMSDKYNFATL